MPAAAAAALDFFCHALIDPSDRYQQHNLHQYLPALPTAGALEQRDAIELSR
jgi:hypothetical protein